MGEVTFRQSPLVEVSFGIRFNKPAALHSGHFGLFWAKIKGDFPETADQVPIIDPAQISTRFGAFGTDLLIPRVWFIHTDKSLLIQLQQDRFYLNWRRLQPKADYPRFATLLPEFNRLVSEWVQFVDEQGLGELTPNACELSYINHLVPPAGGQDFWEAGSLLVPLVAVQPPGRRPLTAVNWAGMFDTQTSRLSATLQTVQNAMNRNEKILQFELKAESLGDVSSVALMVDWMQKANLDVVEAFTSLTTDFAQQEIWGRVYS